MEHRFQIRIARTAEIVFRHIKGRKIFELQ